MHFYSTFIITLQSSIIIFLWNNFFSRSISYTLFNSWLLKWKRRKLANWVAKFFPWLVKSVNPAWAAPRVVVAGLSLLLLLLLTIREQQVGGEERKLDIIRRDWLFHVHSWEHLELIYRCEDHDIFSRWSEHTSIIRLFSYAPFSSMGRFPVGPALSKANTSLSYIHHSLAHKLDLWPLNWDAITDTDPQMILNGIHPTVI